MACAALRLSGMLYSRRLCSTASLTSATLEPCCSAGVCAWELGLAAPAAPAALLPTRSLRSMPDCCRMGELLSSTCLVICVPVVVMPGQCNDLPGQANAQGSFVLQLLLHGG
jgi:hypothetical protein